MDVLVDDGVVLSVDDDMVANGGGDGHGGADGRQRVICGGSGGGVLLVVVAGRGHEHDCGRRISAAAGLVCQHPIAFVRTGTAGTRAERPPARLVVRVEQVRVDIVVAAACVHVGRHRVQMMVMMMVVMAVCTVHQRLRFLQTRNNVLFITTVPDVKINFFL